MGARTSKSARAAVKEKGEVGDVIEAPGTATVEQAPALAPEGAAEALEVPAAEAGSGDAETEVTLVPCHICMEVVPLSTTFKLHCEHSYCRGCLSQYFGHEVREGRTALRCPDCKTTPSEAETSDVLGEELWERYLALSISRWLTQHPHARRCAGVDCNNAVLIGDLDRSEPRGLFAQLTGRFKQPCMDVPTRWKCTRPGCAGETCLRCGHAWHPAVSCEEVVALEDIGLTDDVIGGESGEVRPCPHCKTPIFKIDDGSCNHMICQSCGKHFCWLCMKEVNDLHFLTPSGCTYFASQQWSLSKKALNQIAMAIVAPVAVGVGAAVSVPAIMVWFPRWAVKRTRARINASQTMQRNLSVVGAGAGAFLASPVVAGVAVGLGVPAALILAYIVVPQYLLHEYITNKRRRDRERRDFLERLRRRAAITADEEAASASTAPTSTAVVVAAAN